MQSDVIDTEEGPAFVVREGSGPVTIILHGGPGFDHRYMRDAFGFLARGRSLVFFDQPGCGRTPAPAPGPSLEHTVRHARAVICRIAGNRPVGIVAHSWGALLYIALLDTDHRAKGLPPIDFALLINPLPVTWQGYDAVRRNFVARMPFPARLRILWRALRGAGGARVMELLMPYYLADRNASEIHAMPLAIRTYLTVSRRLGKFDYSGVLAEPGKHFVIHGAKDFTAGSDISNIADTAVEFLDMPGVGHFPFFEAETAFRRLVEQTLNRIDGGSANS